MILDTSAIVAAIAGEPDGARFQEAMLGAASMAIASVTVLETRIVLHSRQGDEVVRAFDEMLENAGVVMRIFPKGSMSGRRPNLPHFGIGKRTPPVRAG